MAAPDAGATLTALAALLTAVTGMISAGVAAMVTLRRKGADATQAAADAKILAAAVAQAVADEMSRQEHSRKELDHA